MIAALLLCIPVCGCFNTNSPQHKSDTSAVLDGMNDDWVGHTGT
jgi:hypothetical protein